ncbi:AtpZ/AtpI family protein [Cereibacter sphaeroides]|uniref:AtpZ/AtpI family protein n=1 Tax=Rhodobacterales TaxID=204455 RepID=UPI000BBE9C3E|nr:MULTISPECIES: AtpZ/AtpI family protein [Paracoccaceae]MCE6950016.1 AtpZ/AtpI family protein [Cereibacter sphaeroides]MCE6958463.1 AtpZ/AtpI family protein [Cereibacter sphaeroides]MCE6967747.1 AtpZ/AtpI family protein [Cereibacter sphaeroides]MCE6972668.1 AtpZ/AtpI family protein [Cereibacter sphaeroides]
MTEDPDSERMRVLEARLAKLKGKPPGKGAEAGKALSQGELAWRMVIELVTGVLIGLAIGYGLDELFGTRPIMLVLFALFGFAAGVRTMMGTARKMGDAAAAAQMSAGKPDDETRGS